MTEHAPDTFPVDAPAPGSYTTARLDRTSFGVTKKKGMVGRTVDLVIEAVARSA